jgi:hypothetical protein
MLMFQVKMDDGVHSDSASLGSNPSPPANIFKHLVA